MLEAGRYFLRKQQRSTGVSDPELIKIAVKSMGLDELYEFEPQQKIIEYVLAADAEPQLVDQTLKVFVEETASESPAPGGGSVSAALGALGAALGTMVANLSSHRRGWDDRWEEFSDWAERGKATQLELLHLVDEDTRAFNAILEAFRLPAGSEQESAVRDDAIQKAIQHAIEVPLRVMEVALDSMETIGAMAEIGQETSASDAGVGALCARSAVLGAYLNVRINVGDLADKEQATAFVQRGAELAEQADARETEILKIVESKL
jgi:glutamate formiminotransferase/formiminotetrahydrofolate cyclodeaminase